MIFLTKGYQGSFHARQINQVIWIKMKFNQVIWIKIKINQVIWIKIDQIICIELKLKLTMLWLMSSKIWF